MTNEVFYSIGGAGLIALGLYGLIAMQHALRRILAVNIMGSGVFLILVALAARAEGSPDPVPHAMVLTGIVVAVSATALAIALSCRLHELDGQGPNHGPDHGSDHGPDHRPARGGDR